MKIQYEINVEHKFLIKMYILTIAHRKLRKIKMKRIFIYIKRKFFVTYIYFLYLTDIWQFHHF